ncbi:hypothetical protein H9I45_00425 [Polaribacter haliotis]|uniref:Uncharacterized protein n=1 Tax=Polaribacter haliotis TaxID=1888915 RepID=A0A7L8AGK5_9FLAO|nr:hypothetical protein [Polaribacter haliotis]QOD60939.1 hypothetical protein H9I45_00425 [Polaribacter haliotis]
MTRRTFYKIIAGIILYFSLNTFYKLYKNNTISKTCLSETFNKKFSDLSKLEINSIHDFNIIFNCEDWDEIYIISSMYYDRGIGFLTTGILVPSYNRFDYFEGTSLLFFIKNNAIISDPLPFYNDHFIFSNNYNRVNSARFDRENSKFIYKKYEHSDYDFTTLELVEK